MCEITEKLGRFNVRVGYLVDSSLLKWLKARGNKQPNMSKLLAGDWLSYEGLSRESLDSYFLHLRLVLQSGDGYSARQIGEIYDGLPGKFSELTEMSVKLREELNNYLSAPTGLRLKENSPLSRQELLDTLLYGHFAHEKPKHIKDFKDLTASGFFSLFSFLAFANLIMTITDIFRRMAVLNQATIEWLQQEPDNA